MDNQLVIDVKGLRKSFSGLTVVNDIDLTVKKGEVFGFLGPNGSGKTTTIRMLCGLLTPDAGQGTCLGFDILTQSDEIKKKVGYMTQRYSFYGDLTVEENLKFIAKVYQVKDSQTKIIDVMQKMDLMERRRQLTSQLSGGWKQRVALAACLLHEPDLLLLDEPTGGIDPLARRDFWDTIHELSTQGITTLMSTHYMDEAERCTRLAYIAYGNLIITGTVNDVILSSKLQTWEILTDFSNTHLLQEVKKIAGVSQVALFGQRIHVCGHEIGQIEEGLRRLSVDYVMTWKKISSTLEDAFISLEKELGNKSS